MQSKKIANLFSYLHKETRKQVFEIIYKKWNDLQ